MYVSRGDLSPEQISAKRNRELEKPSAVSSSRKIDQDRSGLRPEEANIPVDNQKMRRTQGALARAQSMLAGLELFRSALSRTEGQGGGERAALQVLDHSRYQGEAVLEPYRQALQRAAADRDPRFVDRLIGTVRQNIAALAQDQDAGGEPAAKPPLAALTEGIRSIGSGLERLSRENVLRLLG
jgi:hypothetical protein